MAAAGLGACPRAVSAAGWTGARGQATVTVPAMNAAGPGQATVTNRATSWPGSP
jgi:hypothetical protein